MRFSLTSLSGSLLLPNTPLSLLSAVVVRVSPAEFDKVLSGYAQDITVSVEATTYGTLRSTAAGSVLPPAAQQRAFGATTLLCVNPYGALRSTAAENIIVYAAPDQAYKSSPEQVLLS